MNIRDVVRAILPAPMLTALVTRRARRHSHRLNAAWGIAGLSETLLDRFEGRVQAGPFKGLVLPKSAAPEHVGPYLLGTYERELHDFWAALAPGSIPLVVNIGAKIGYYAVGLALRLGAPVIAYDADAWARGVLARTVALNRADVTIRGRCTREALDRLPPRTLVVIDCDGCEEVLLRDPLPPGLRHTALVVEMHGALVENDETAERLARTHHVVTVPSLDTPPPPSTLPFLSEHHRKLAVVEIRSAQRWLLCTPRA